MFHKIVLVTVSLIALAIGALGCGSQSTATTIPPTTAPAASQPTNTSVPAQAATQAPTNAPTDAPAATMPTQAATTGERKIYACSLFSRVEAEAIMGKPVVAVPTTPIPGMENIQSTCVYEQQDGSGKSAELQVMQWDTPKMMHTTFEDNKAAAKRLSDAEPEMVPGLGNEAFWSGTAPRRKLQVRQDNLLLIIKIAPKVEDALVEQLAKKMLGHLDDVFIIPPPSDNMAQQPTSAPATKSAAQPTAQPTKPAPTAANSDSSSASFDGEWKGETSMKGLSGKNIPFTFTVANNKISQVTQDFRVPSGVCEGFSGSGNDHPNVSIQNNAFTVKWENKLSAKSFNKAEITGTFQSPTQASGTMHFSGNSSFCGEYDFEATWTASK